MTATSLEHAETAVAILLRLIGEDPTREGLRDTPERVARTLTEMTCGYWEDPADILATTFEVACDELIVVRDLDFVSLCEHHLLPFTGTATIAYLPNERIVGLSKLARLVHLYARRLQIQERLTTQIGEALMTHVAPLGVGVIVQARHTCMTARGIRTDGEMVTSSLLGVLRTNEALRAEFLALRGRA